MQHTCYCVTAHNQPLERMDVTTPEPKGAEVLMQLASLEIERPVSRKVGALLRSRRNPDCQSQDQQGCDER